MAAVATCVSLPRKSINTPPSTPARVPTARSWRPTASAAVQVGLSAARAGGFLLEEAILRDNGALVERRETSLR